MSPQTYRQLYMQARAALPSEFEARQLFCHTAGVAFHQLPSLGDQAAPAENARLLEKLLRRRLAGEPLQYLLGEWEFYSLPFFVGEGVLIPRPDTELLVERALDYARGWEHPRIMDLCSGSGAVAVALAHSLPRAWVLAVEWSEAAFGYLERNIARNGVEVQAVRADLFAYQPAGLFEVITANPPYIPSDEIQGLQPEVGHEPRAALDGGPDGLHFYRGIGTRYHQFLSEKGVLCLEVGVGQADAVAGILEECGFRQTEISTDLSGIRRVVCCRR